MPTLQRTLHSSWKTPWLELPLHHSPRFRMREKSPVEVPLPRPEEKGPEMQIDLSSDVKISFTFADEKLIVPWTVAYDAKTGQYLTELIVKFYHDDFDVHMIDFTPKHSTDKLRVSSIPHITIIYEWEALQEDDIGTGVIAMFSITLLLTIMMVYFGGVLRQKKMSASEHKERERRVAASSNINNSSSSLGGVGSGAVGKASEDPGMFMRVGGGASRKSS